MSIFNDVVENISKEVSKVQERSQEMLHGFNLNSQIKDLERKKTQKLSELGELIFDRYHHEKEVSEDDIKEKVAEVAGYQDQISVLEAELEAANISRDPNASRAKKAAHKAGYRTTPGFVCGTCGTPASKDKKFCPACGSQLKEEEEEPKSESKKKTTGKNEPLDVEPEEEDEKEDSTNGDGSDENPEDKKKADDE